MLRFLLIALFALGLGACTVEPPPYTNVDNAGLKKLVDEGIPLFDVRRPEEWRETGVVKGSRLLTFVDEAGRVKPGFLETLTQRISPDQPVALICRTGNRTDVLARYLVDKLGYQQVYNVREGITGWIGDGLPVNRRGS